ncbi:hypothetical protein GALMADRAFT_248998 [Galerina marginata CBS 339.88]|uniref:Gti1/Pac2 family-domain-containing protein n=1 Tax=Galerina marginata (strain CBS 339.88) TaxID=685588 RepID=A0A067SW29_GALM3|nr:hypothetical protein GALMADRAFT_248998 [Galerina marginata CBS 339.88]
MQPPTCVGLRVRTPSDAHIIFHAVATNILRMVTRRLDTDERRAISSGCVYVWQERGATAEATGLGIERWTDSISWGPSRVRDEFLYYHERRPMQAELETTSDSDTATHGRRGYFRQSLIKQTYSVFVATPYGRQKWHLIAYFTQETVGQLNTIDNHPLLANLQVPQGVYTCARSSKTRPQALPPTQIIYRQQHVSIVPKYIPPPGAFQTLAPLAYLNRLPPPRRHVLDEMALMSFSP